MENVNGIVNLPFQEKIRYMCAQLIADNKLIGKLKTHDFLNVVEEKDVELRKIMYTHVKNSEELLTKVVEELKTVLKLWEENFTTKIEGYGEATK